MKVLVTSTKDFEKEAFKKVIKECFSSIPFELTYSEVSLTEETAKLSEGYDVVCAFVSDKLNRACLQQIRTYGVKLLALRSAGFNHVDVEAAQTLGIEIMRVPRYSPQAIAEFTIGLYLCLNRKIHRAHDRVKDGNFSLHGLVGRDIYKQTIGVVGTGNIGKCVAQIFRGFGSKVLVHDVAPDEPWAESIGAEYCDWKQLLQTSDVITLHVPLTTQTRYLINEDSLSKMKEGAFLINTSRGGMVNTFALIQALKEKHLSGAALDVYEEEENYFFKDFSDGIIDDDTLARLMTFSNVLITSHQAFLTREALEEIAKTTIQNILDWERGLKNENTIKKKT